MKLKCKNIAALGMTMFMAVATALSSTPNLVHAANAPAAGNSAEWDSIAITCVKDLSYQDPASPIYKYIDWTSEDSCGMYSGVTSSGISGDAYCMEPQVFGFDAGATKTYNGSNANIYPCTDPTVQKLCAYGTTYAASLGEGNPDAQKYLVHVALSKYASETIGITGRWDIGNRADSGNDAGGRNAMIQQMIVMAQQGGIAESDDIHAYVINPTEYSQAMYFAYVGQKKGAITLQKTSAIPAISDDNACYDLGGAVYGIYRSDNDTLVAQLTTGSDGKTGTEAVDFDEYYVKEISAPKGYMLDDSRMDVSVHSTDAITVNTEDLPGNDPVKLVLQKKDADTKSANPLGGARLEGAQYEVKYYDLITEENPASSGYVSKRNWIFETDKRGQIYLQDKYLVSGDSLYTGVTGAAVLPLGTYTFHEIKAPKGYRIDPGTYVVNTSMDALHTTVVTSNLPNTEDYYSPEKIMRGDFELRKIDGRKQKTMAGISFEVTSKTTGESHKFTVDDNGEYRSTASWIPHSYNTNGGKDGDGLWFAGAKDGQIKTDDLEGALPYDTYEIRELACDKNKGKELFEGEFSVYKDMAIVQLGNIENQDKPQPEIHTTAAEEVTGSKELSIDEEVKIVDQVEYKNLKPGKTYELHATLMDASTGKEILDENGKPVTAKSEFTPKEADGKTKVIITVNTTKLEGKSLVVFEKLYLDKKEIAAHEDLEDKGQTVNVPKKPEKPEQPPVPEQPKTPEQPHVPEQPKPQETTTVTKTVYVPVAQKHTTTLPKTSAAPKTGDVDNIVYAEIAGLLLFACLTALVIIVYRRKHSDKEE